jgi:hypothetical protein
VLCIKARTCTGGNFFCCPFAEAVSTLYEQTLRKDLQATAKIKDAVTGSLQRYRLWDTVNNNPNYTAHGHELRFSSPDVQVVSF